MIEKFVLEALREACSRAGNQVKLSRKAGLAQGQISDYLCGRRKVKNMTLGTLEKIFPELMLVFFRDREGLSVDPVEAEIAQLAHSMTFAQKLSCLKIIAANFPDSIISEAEHSERDPAEAARSGSEKKTRNGHGNGI